MRGTEVRENAARVQQTMRGMEVRGTEVRENDSAGKRQCERTTNDAMNGSARERQTMRGTEVREYDKRCKERRERTTNDARDGSARGRLMMRGTEVRENTAIPAFSMLPRDRLFHDGFVS